MSGFQLSPSSYSFDGAFAGIPVEIQYQVDASEDHSGCDVTIVPTVCVINEHAIDLCEDAGYFHTEQLKTWLAEAEADYKSLGRGADDAPYNYLPGDTLDYLAAAEDCWIALRDHVYCAGTGL